VSGGYTARENCCRRCQTAPIPTSTTNMTLKNGGRAGLRLFHVVDNSGQLPADVRSRLMATSPKLKT